MTTTCGPFIAGSAHPGAREHGPPATDDAAWWDARAAGWDRADPWRITRTRELREEWVAILRDVIGDTPRLVGEIGFGTGDLALALYGLGHVVRGADASREMVRTALDKARRAGAHLDLRCAAADRLPFGDGTLDVVIARNVLWHLPSPESAVLEWRRVLRPGGRVLVAESRWIPDTTTRPGRALARLVPGSTHCPPGTHEDRRGSTGVDAATFLACTGFHRSMVLDLSWLRHRTWGALPWHVRAFARPRGLHYVAWAERL